MRFRRLAGDDLPPDLLIFHETVEGVSYDGWLAARAEWAQTRDWMAGPLVPFTAPQGSLEAVWAAWEHWCEDLTTYEKAHPCHAAQVATVRELSETPDQPWNGSDL